MEPHQKHTEKSCVLHVKYTHHKDIISIMSTITVSLQTGQYCAKLGNLNMKSIRLMFLSIHILSFYLIYTYANNGKYFLYTSLLQMPFLPSTVHHVYCIKFILKTITCHLLSKTNSEQTKVILQWLRTML